MARGMCAGRGGARERVQGPYLRVSRPAVRDALKDVARQGGPGAPEMDPEWALEGKRAARMVLEAGRGRGGRATGAPPPLRADHLPPTRREWPLCPYVGRPPNRPSRYSSYDW